VAGYSKQKPGRGPCYLGKTVIDTLFEAVRIGPQTQVRYLLGSFCFSNDGVFKEVGKLKRWREKHGSPLAPDASSLPAICWLVLDEPTNTSTSLPNRCLRRRPGELRRGGPAGFSHDRLLHLAGGQPDRRDPRRRAGALPAAIYAITQARRPKRRKLEPGGRPPPRCRSAKKSANREKQEKPAPP